MDALILAAGEGTRLRPLTFTMPKPLIPILGRPLVAHIAQSLASAGASRIGLIVGRGGDLFREILGASVSYAEQNLRLGIAHAIHVGVEAGLVRGPFVVHLGDNFFERGVADFVRAFAEGGYDAFMVLAEVPDPRRFGYAVLEGGRVVKLIEKPRDPPPGGMTVAGFYGFRDPDLVERAFRDLRPSARGEYEVTDLLQWFIDRGHSVGYAVADGWWKDMGTPRDLLDLLYLMLDGVEARIEGEVRGEVRGRVVVEKGAVVEGEVHGPAYIGRGARVGRDAKIEHFVDLEAGASVEGGSLSRVLALEGSSVVLGSARLVDSVVGPRSRVSLKAGTASLIIGEGNAVEVG